MRIVVGLGNPGSAYAGTRHNVGFAVIEELASRWQLPLGPVRRGARVAHGIVAGADTVLIEPQLHMNRSGDVLARLEPSVAAAQLIVVHDDLDLDPGCVRVKCGGGTAGHRGLDSIVAHCGAEFTRVRVGIGRPPAGAEAVDYVLSPFDTSQHDVVSAALQCAADAVECVLREGEERAMNCFNVRAKSGAGTVAAPVGRN
jgi:PTH1 family peptidyl-tRNA hydrolase